MKQEVYVTPECEVMEMELQGMIAASELSPLGGYPAADGPGIQP